MEKLYNKEEAAAFILNKFKEQGDFSFIDEKLFCDMVRDIQELDSQYIDQFESEDAVYDDDEAYERIHGAMTEKYPDFKTYMMRLVDDYLDYSEDYLESIGAIDWE